MVTGPASSVKSQRANAVTQTFDVCHLLAAIDTATEPGEYPNASCVIDDVLVYDAAVLVAKGADAQGRTEILHELANVLDGGPGVFVVRAAVERSVLDSVTAAFEDMIDRQNAAGVSAGDHFAAPGANDRVWNALEKLALAEPDLFVAYYSCEVLRLASLAWLGPHYQVTSQLNRVNPGGQAQKPHCDYHLGFMSPQQAAAFPARVHHMSRSLTLQGAIAHCDMPVASGPTMLLPHSHKYAGGYLHSTQPEVAALFADRQTQLELQAGDAMFFNPSLIHGAGTNTTPHIKRIANLLQISSAFGRAMELVDRTAMCSAIYPALRRCVAAGRSTAYVENALAATAEGYSFPTNLDLDPPTGGLAPPSQADVMRRALAEQLTHNELVQLLVEHAQRR
jgi:ectoine hydroxylase-related dioxygenase (phytanoyl-CoA dioxygenase family)